MSNDPFKLKPVNFKDLPRQSKLAQALYMDHSPFKDEIRQTLSREGWKLDKQKLLKDHERGCCSPLDGRMKR